MRASDLPLLTSVSRPTLHPSGRRAIVGVSHPDLDSDRYVGQLWSVPVTGHASPRRLTRGVRDSAPQYSPDGRLIAFLRTVPGKPPQVYVLDSNGGEPVQVTDKLLGADEFAWSPDGSAIAFVSRVPERGRYGSVEGIEPGAEPPRRMRTLRYRANGVGYITDRRAQVFLVPVPDVWAEPPAPAAPTADGPADVVDVVPSARQLTDDDADHGGVVFRPNGKGVAFVTARHKNRDNDLRQNIFTLSLENGAEPVDATGQYGSFSVLDTAGALHYASDGALYFLAQDVGRNGRDFVGKNAALYVIEEEGAAPRRLTDPETVDLAESAVTPYDENTVLVQNRTRGSVQLLRIGRSGESSPLTASPIEVTGVAAVAGTVVISYADARTAGDVAVLQHGGIRRLTDFSAPLRDSGLIEPTELTIDSRDGYPVHGWVVIPEGEGPHPVLLNIHGGPFGQYSVSVFDEAQVYAAAGYAVVMCNPRGSAGYGQAHGRSIRRAMGTVDLKDVLDFLDGSIAGFEELDGDRVGILGGSYGGYLTAWTIAHDSRFAGAIVERGFLDPEFFVGTSDIGSFFSDEYVGTDPERIRTQSPQAVVDAVRTPTLVLHSEEDLRCPLSQAERYYAALARRGVETELVIFPGENHELSRSGRPRHREERFAVILDWWARHLPTLANPTPKKPPAGRRARQR